MDSTNVANTSKVDTSKLPVSIDTFDPLKPKARIDSPRSVQAATNLGIDIDDLYVKAAPSGLSEQQQYVVEQSLEKIRAKLVDEVRAERQRLDVLSPKKAQEDIFGMTQTSFFLSPERQSQKLEQVRRQQERDLMVLVQEEVRITGLQSELQRKYDSMERSQAELLDQRRQKKEEAEWQRAQKEEQIRKQLTDIQQQRERKWTQKQEREREREEREQKKFLIRTQLQKSISEDKDMKLKSVAVSINQQAQISIKQTQEREQQRIDALVEQNQQKEREKQELLDHNHQTQMAKMRHQSEEYDRKLCEIRKRIEQMEELMQVRVEEKQRRIDQKLVEREQELAYRQTLLRERSEQQAQQIAKAQEKKQELEVKRQQEILESLRKSDQQQQQFEEYQRSLVAQRQIQSSQQHERFTQKKQRLDEGFQTSLAQKHYKTTMLVQSATMSVLKQRQDLTEYLSMMDKQKFDHVKQNLEHLQQTQEKRTGLQYNRSMMTMRNATLNAERLKQQSMENMMANDVVRQITHETNFKRIRSREQSRRERIDQQLSTKSKRLSTLDAEKQRNQATFLQQVLRMQNEHQELKQLLERARRTGRYDDVHRFLAKHEISTTTSLQPGPQLQERLGFTSPARQDVIQHGDHTHPRNPETEQIINKQNN